MSVSGIYLIFNVLLYSFNDLLSSGSVYCVSFCVVWFSCYLSHFEVSLTLLVCLDGRAAWLVSRLLSGFSLLLHIYICFPALP